MYFFAGSMVIGGSLDQLVGLLNGMEVGAEAVSEGTAEVESEVEPEGETGAEALLPEDAEDPAAESTVPLEAQPDSSNPLTAATTPMPIL